MKPEPTPTITRGALPGGSWNCGAERLKNVRTGLSGSMVTGLGVDCSVVVAVMLTTAGPYRSTTAGKSRGTGALGAARTALVPAEATRHGDPTGCGDVWGATYFSRLIAGDKLGDAIVAAHRAAARNVEHRGATGLANYLRGELSLR